MTETDTTTDYVRAEIVDYGDMTELTQTAVSGPNFDGGSGANIYTS